ncbi:MAG: hypothetical protein M1840_003843 [Geoglossum simile]|nr:MAG: hypothetical protein M1840_003843 [Geoglossum simile]
MRNDIFGAPTWTSENLDPSYLILIWKDITHTLISSEYAAELHKELNTAGRTGREDAAGGQASSLAYQRHEESCRGPALSDESQSVANSAENNRSTIEFDIEDEDTVMSSPDESEADDDIYNDLAIPSYIIDEAADLSHHGHACPLLSFEEILAREQSLLQRNRRCAELEDTPVCLDSDSMSMSGTPPSTLTLPPSESEHNQWLNAPSIDMAPEQDLTLEAERRDSLSEETKPIPLQPTLYPRSRKAGGLRVSDKNDLTPANVLVVARLLINKDSISYFLDNCHLIYEGWMPFSAQQPLVCNNSIETSIIAALDTVQDLLKGNRIRCLLLRFAYIHLAWVIDTYKATAATDRVQGKVSRQVGQRDASVAIDMYLQAKRKISGEELKRSKLLGYYRTGRRWSLLAGPSPMSVFVFSRVAETIVQNNSITDSTIQAIATQIQDNHPELVRILAEVGQYTGLAYSSTTHSMPRLEDVVARANKALGPVLCTMS